MQVKSCSLPHALRRVIGCVIAERYLVGEVIGTGGMAVVFRGEHTQLRRDVAIKILRPEYTHYGDVAERFDREARATANFDHPNCVQVFDCGLTTHGLKFMVMPLLQGNELALSVGKRMPASQAAYVGLHLLRGLGHAHAHGVVHRDVKPDNAFVTRDHAGVETIKLVDFGIAKLREEGPDALKTEVGVVVGTPAYMSPEQARGREVDGRADLYALGMTLYQLVNGALPFTTDDDRVILYQQVHGTPPELAAAPAVFNAALARLLAKRCEDRFASATEAIARFEAVARALRRDPSPWLPLLSTDAGSPQPGLRAVDKALRRVLAEPTPMVTERLKTTFETPDPAPLSAATPKP